MMETLAKILNWLSIIGLSLTFLLILMSQRALSKRLRKVETVVLRSGNGPFDRVLAMELEDLVLNLRAEMRSESYAANEFTALVEDILKFYEQRGFMSPKQQRICAMHLAYRMQGGEVH